VKEALIDRDCIHLASYRPKGTQKGTRHLAPIRIPFLLWLYNTLQTWERVVGTMTISCSQRCVMLVAIIYVEILFSDAAPSPRSNMDDTSAFPKEAASGRTAETAIRSMEEPAEYISIGLGETAWISISSYLDFGARQVACDHFEEAKSTEEFDFFSNLLGGISSSG
jgi:hypothetical protein